MDSLFHDAGDDSEDAEEGGPPSIEAIVAAFREAADRPAGRGASGERPSPGRLRDEGEMSPDSMVSGPAPSPADIVQDTIAAFRKVEEKRAGRERGGPDRSDSDVEGEPSPAPSDDAPDESEAGGLEDFGPAFRKALSERGDAGPQDFKDILEDAGETDDTDAGESDDAASPADEPSEDAGGTEPTPAEGSASADEDVEEEDSSDAEVEPVERRGDTLPPSEKVEMSAGSDSVDASLSGEDFPPRPAESFLWVSAEPVDDPAVVSVDDLGEERAKDADAFLLRGRGEEPYKLLTRIRGHSAMHVYLKPVFWRHAEGQQSPVSRHVDGAWTEDERSAFQSLQGQATSINQRIENLVGIGGQEEGGVELRVLRFMATRNHEFTPHRTAENSDGFVYPKLSPLLERGAQSGGGDLAQVLSVLEERRLLTGEFVMRQHACRNCTSAFLNFEEMCPHCGSNNIDADDLVHHFRCAFTGALSEYKKEKGKLVCPKCDRQLKQIGVDYDKPSVVYTCRRCHEQFQDPDVQTTCYRCEHTNPPEQQIEREIKEYEVTALGEETAVHGLSDSLLSILERESRVMDYGTFQLIVESEAARIERYQRSESCLLLVRVSGLNQVRMELGERSEEVIEEIATAFDNTLRTSDYLSARDESLYLFLLTETDQSGARRAGERLEENIEGVLHQNLQHPPELDIAVQPVRPGIDLDGLAERFLATHTREPAAVNGR